MPNQLSIRQERQVLALSTTATRRSNQSEDCLHNQAIIIMLIQAVLELIHQQLTFWCRSRFNLLTQVWIWRILCVKPLTWSSKVVKHRVWQVGLAYLLMVTTMKHAREVSMLVGADSITTSKARLCRLKFQPRWRWMLALSSCKASCRASESLRPSRLLRRLITLSFQKVIIISLKIWASTQANQTTLTQLKSQERLHTVVTIRSLWWCNLSPRARLTIKWPQSSRLEWMLNRQM